jgi:hypothetical protein
MDEDISIINSNTRNEKIKNFFIQNKKYLISAVVIVVLILVGYFGYDEYKTGKKIKISESYNATIIDFNENNKSQTVDKLIAIINQEDATYSPLALYFIIDNNLLDDVELINSLFDILINKTPVEKEIKNLIIYKKALFNADESDESRLLNILNPIINSDSVWKSHALYLMAEFFYDKNEKQKAKEFFNQILTLENANVDLRQEAQKRLNRDLSE